jgi:hypothetical protein
MKCEAYFSGAISNEKNKSKHHEVSKHRKSDHDPGHWKKSKYRTPKIATAGLCKIHHENYTIYNLKIQCLPH